MTPCIIMYANKLIQPVMLQAWSNRKIPKNLYINICVEYSVERRQVESEVSLIYKY